MDATRRCQLRRARGRRAGLSLSGMLLAALVVAGCGTYGTSSGSGSGSGSMSSPHSGASGASSSIPCAQITSLETALTSLTKTKVNPAHTGLILSDLATISTQLRSLSSQAGPAFSGQARQLSSELTTVEAAARHLLVNPSPANVTTLTGTVNHLKATAGPLVAELKSVCPSPGSS